MVPAAFFVTGLVIWIRLRGRRIGFDSKKMRSKSSANLIA